MENTWSPTIAALTGQCIHAPANWPAGAVRRIDCNQSSGHRAKPEADQRRSGYAGRHHHGGRTMPRSYYDEMLIAKYAASIPRSKWIDRCTMELGRLHAQHSPERLAEIATELYLECAPRWPEDAARLLGRK